MALISCPECNSSVSDQATNCPQCGYPIKTAATVVKNEYVSPLTEARAERALVERAIRSSTEHRIVKTSKSRGVYIILGLFFGCLGIHNFYAGYLSRGLVQLLIILILGWFIIGFIVVGMWVIIELFAVTTDAAGDPLV